MMWFLIIEKRRINTGFFTPPQRKSSFLLFQTKNTKYIIVLKLSTKITQYKIVFMLFLSSHLKEDNMTSCRLFCILIAFQLQYLQYVIIQCKKRCAELFLPGVAPGINFPSQWLRPPTGGLKYYVLVTTPQFFCKFAIFQIFGKLRFCNLQLYKHCLRFGL